MKKILLPPPIMRNITLFTLVLAALTACTNDTFIGNDEAMLDAQGERAISFGFDVPAPTRASGSEAATALGNQFIVYGEKGDITNVAPAAGNLVFPNYQVNYVTNTAYTTTSNTKDWEYVGATHSSNYQNNITRDPSSAAADEIGASDAVQTIKYWDYAAANYIFTAVSALGTDIETGRVKIQKNEYGTTAYDKGYTITLAKDGSSVYPTLNKLYFADRNVIATSAGTDRTAVNTYGGNVTFTFRNLVSQVRAGVYETNPGYDVTAIKFYVDNGSGEQTTVAQVSSVNAFGAKCPNISTTNYEGTINVTYYSSGDVENQPKVTASGVPTTNLILGTNMNGLSTSNLLGKTADSPTWDTDGGTFTEVLPQIENATNLKLKVDYTLWNSVTQETIKITGKTAEVPAKYLQWKPNFKYTYLFKITDNDLYPITFDAVVVEATDGTAEYITTVSEPSITTFGVKGGNYQVGKNEYEAGTDIYATIMDASAVQTPVEGTNVNYYSVDWKAGATADDKEAFPITEASVAETIAEIANPSGRMIVATKNNNLGAPVTQVPAEDGTTIDQNAVKFEALPAGIYAIEYIKTPATYNTSSEAHTFADADELATWETSNYKLYDNADGTTPATATNAEKTYYKRVSVKTVGVYAYKVIKVVAAP